MLNEKRVIYVEDALDELRAYADRKHAAGHNDLANGILKAVGYIRNNMVGANAVVLPCKLGTQVFVLGGKYRAGRFDQWINTGKFRLSDLEKMGKTVFLTREEAEVALAERRAKDAL